MRQSDGYSTEEDKLSVVVATNWGEGDSKYDYFYPILDQFAKDHEDTIDLTLQTYSTEDYKTKIKTQTASGDLPDVFTYWGGGMMANMVDAGLDELFIKAITAEEFAEKVQAVLDK